MLLACDPCIFKDPDDFSAPGAELSDVLSLLLSHVITLHETLNAPLDDFVFDALFDGKFAD